MQSVNEYWTFLYGETPLCARCGERRPIRELNAEAIHHHNAKELICIDRKACERRRRKNRK